jgi:cytoskeleton protein RodZ
VCAEDFWVQDMTNDSVRNDEAITADDIGTLLRNARADAGFSVVEIAEMTRITKSHITALEDNDYSRLPGIAYIPGFIRNYCKVVNIDPQPLIAAYKQTTNPERDKPVYKFPVQALVPKMAGSMVAMFVVVAGLAGYIGWNFLQEDTASTAQIASLDDSSLDNVKRFDQTEAVEPEILDPEPAPLAAIQQIQPEVENNPSDEIAPANTEISESVEIANAPAETDASAPLASQNSNTADQQGDIQQILEDTVPALQAQQIAALAPAEASRSTTPPSANIGEAPHLQNPETEFRGGAAQALQRNPMSEIVISASSTSWVEIAKANGEIVVSKLLRKGDNFVATADTKLFLSTGNAGGISLKMGDQKAVKIGKTGEIIRDLALTRDSLSLIRDNSQF